MQNEFVYSSSELSQCVLLRLNLTSITVNVGFRHQWGTVP